MQQEYLLSCWRICILPPQILTYFIFKQGLALMLLFYGGWHMWLYGVGGKPFLAKLAPRKFNPSNKGYNVVRDFTASTWGTSISVAYVRVRVCACLCACVYLCMCVCVCVENSAPPTHTYALYYFLLKMKMTCQIRIGAALALRYWKVAAGRLPCWRERWRGGFPRARDVGAEPGNHAVYSVLGRRSFLLWAPLLAHQYKVGAIVQVYSFLSPQSSQPRTVVRDAVPRCTMLCLGIPCHAKPCCAMQSQLNMGIIYICVSFF